MTQQVQVGQAPQHRVQNLSDDLANLFGSVGKTAETYNRIGDTAAKIDAFDKINEARMTVSAIKQSVSENKDDPEVYNQARSAIDDVTANLIADSTRYNNHQDAFDTYSKLVTDFSVGLKESYYPVIAEEQFSALQKSFDTKATNSSLLARKSNIPFTKDEVTSLSSDATFYRKDRTEYTHKAFATNYDILHGSYNADKAKWALDNKVLKTDKDGNLQIDRKALESVILRHFGSHIKIVNGDVQGDADYTLQEEVDKVQSIAGLIVSDLTKDGGEEGKHPDFDVWLKVGNEAFLSSKDASLLANNEWVKKVLSTPKNQLNKSQKEAKHEFSLNLQIKESDWNKANNVVLNALNTSDTKSLSAFSTIGSQELGIPKADIEVAARNIHNNNELSLLEAINGGNLSGVGQIASAQLKLDTMLNIESKTMKASKELVLGGGVPLSENQILSSIAIEKTRLTMFPNASKEDGTNKMLYNQEWLTTLATEVSGASERAKQLYPNNPESRLNYVKAIFMKARSNGATEYGSLLSKNTTKLRNFDASNMNWYFNLGSHVSVDKGLRDYVAHNLSRQGVDTTGMDGEDVSEKVDAMTHRVSSFWGKAYSFPKVYNAKGKELDDEGYKKLIKHTLKTNNLPIGNTEIADIKTYIRMDSENNPMMMIGIVTPQGRTLTSEYLYGEAIDQLKFDKSYGIIWGSSSPTAETTEILTGKKPVSNINAAKKKAEANIAKIKASQNKK